MDLRLAALAVVLSLLLGFLVGLLAFKVKRRWCPRCQALTSSGVSRFHLEDRLSLWTLLAPAGTTPTFDQLMRVRDYLRGGE